MSAILYPTADNERLIFLNTCMTKGGADHQTNRRLLDNPTRQKVARFHQEFESKLHEVAALQQERNRLVRELKRAKKDLKVNLGVIWNQLRYERVVGIEQTELVKKYGLSARGKNPKTGRRNELLAAARQVIHGDNEAKGTGHCGFPIVEQIETQYDEITDIIQSLDSTKEQISAATQEVQALRVDIHKLCRVVCMELDYNLRDRSPSQKRDIMRLYGVRFRENDKGFDGEESASAVLKESGATYEPTRDAAGQSEEMESPAVPVPTVNVETEDGVAVEDREPVGEVGEAEILEATLPQSVIHEQNGHANGVPVG